MDNLQRALANLQKARLLEGKTKVNPKRCQLTPKALESTSPDYGEDFLASVNDTRTPRHFPLHESRRVEAQTAGGQFCKVNGNAIKQAIEWGKTKPTILSKTFDGLVFDYCKGKVGTLAGYIGEDQARLYINFAEDGSITYDVVESEAAYLKRLKSLKIGESEKIKEKV